MPTEPLKCLDAEGELSDGERSLSAKVPIAKSLQIGFRVVIRAVDDSEILTATTFDGWLTQSLLSFGDEFERFDDHSFATSFCKIKPPLDASRNGVGIRHVDDLVVSSEQQFFVALQMSASCAMCH